LWSGRFGGDRHNFPLAVMAAGFADVMRTLHLTAIRAFDVAGSGQMVMRPAHVAAGLGGLLLWHSHDGNPLRLQARIGRAEGQLSS
jgi:hypothetical protein